jgi:hypothetical protein
VTPFVRVIDTEEGPAYVLVMPPNLAKCVMASWGSKTLIDINKILGEQGLARIPDLYAMTWDELRREIVDREKP